MFFQLKKVSFFFFKLMVCCFKLSQGLDSGEFLLLQREVTR